MTSYNKMENELQSLITFFFIIFFQKLETSSASTLWYLLTASLAVQNSKRSPCFSVPHLND